MSEAITFVFPHQGRTGHVNLEWAEGKSVKTYFNEQPLRAFGLIGKRMTHKMFNRAGLPVKLWYEPKAGDAIVLIQVRAGRN